MVNGQSSMVNGQWSMVNGQWSIINYQLTMVNDKGMAGQTMCQKKRRDRTALFGTGDMKICVS